MTFQRKIIAAFVVGVAVLGGGGAVAYRRLDALSDATAFDELAEREHVRAAARDVSVTLVLSMVATLGFVLYAAAVVRRELRAQARVEDALREARDSAEAANRAKTDFLGRMSHELRTPLNSVIGFSNIMLRRHAIAADDQSRLYLERVRDNGMHLLVMINDLLDMARIEAGRVALHPCEVDLRRLVTAVVESFEDDARERGLTLIATMPDDLAPTVTDPERLRQVVVNLVSNALKFTEQGSVRVLLVADPVTRAPLRLDVVDTGIGIPPAEQAAVFEAFERGTADGPAGTHRSGVGLGLAIARALAELLGYRLELVSAPGRGSTFTVVFASAP